MLSLVALSNSHLGLTLDTLRTHLDRIYPGYFLPPRQQGTFVIDGEVKGVQFLIQSSIGGAKGIFMLNSVPGPYTKFSDFHRHIRDQPLRELAASQRCWLSVDLVRRHTTDDEAYGFIARVIAHLAPKDTVALVDPDRSATIAFSDDVRGRLNQGARVF
jgi:hypothetical protein